MERPRDIAVERAVLVSELIRSESGIPEVSQEDATEFVKTILKTCNICTSTNVKLCTSFISKNILPSSTRVEALMKYLGLLSMSFGPRNLDKLVDTTKPLDGNVGLGRIVKGRVQQPPEPAFKRLHILYIVHDVFCYMMHHVKNAQQQIREQMRWKASTLMELAVCHCCGKRGEVTPKVKELLDMWEKKGIFDSATCARQRDNISLATETEWDTLVNNLRHDGGNRLDQQRKELQEWRKNNLPLSHGIPDDPGAPWHELPAANGLYMLRTQGYPLKAMKMPPQGYLIDGGGQLADPELKKDVANLYDEMMHCYDKYTNAEEVQDIDALGNIIWKDADRPTRNLWGFTLDGIDKRKELARQFATATNSSGDREQGPPVNDAVERARALATERASGMDRGREMPRGGFRGGRRW